jgi:hypothetical protein
MMEYRTGDSLILPLVEGFMLVIAWHIGLMAPFSSHVEW